MKMDLWEQAYELACQRANEEGDVNIDTDYALIETWQEEYYNDLIKGEQNA